MKTNRFVSNELLASIDVLNTLNGGISEPHLSVVQFDDHREVRMKVPGLDEEELRAEIHNNRLTVLYNFHMQTADVNLSMPRVLYNEPIPHYVDVERITASLDDGSLKVTLPFNSMSQGYHRRVSTEN